MGLAFTQLIVDSNREESSIRKAALWLYSCILAFLLRASGIDCNRRFYEQGVEESPSVFAGSLGKPH